MKTILAHGVFDLLHTGHLDHLEQALKFGDHLLVSVVADRFVKKPLLVCDEEARVKMLAALKIVDEVHLCEAPGPELLLRKLHPYTYVRSNEYIDQMKPEYAVCKELGILCHFTKSRPPHTSDLIARIITSSRRGML